MPRVEYGSIGRRAMGAVLLAGLLVSPGRSVSAEQVAAGATRCVAMTGALPGDVVISNLTTTGAAEQGYGTLRSSDDVPVLELAPEERFSSVNFSGASPNPNLAVAVVGTDGQVCYDAVDSPHDLILDQLGVLDGASLPSVPQRRILDTRGEDRPAVDSSLCVDVADLFEEGDLAFVNITPINALGSGFGSLRPSEGVPISERQIEAQFSSVNFSAESGPNPNLATVRLGAERTLCYDASVAAHHVALDVVGGVSAAHVRNVEEVRLIDTRQALDPVAPTTSVCVNVDTTEPDPEPDPDAEPDPEPDPDAEPDLNSDILPGDLAVVNITPARSGGTGYGVLRSSDAPPTNTIDLSEQFSSVNVVSGDSVDPNLSVVPIGADGRVCYDAEGSSHDVILDVVGVISGDANKDVAPSRLLDTRSELPPCPSDSSSGSGALTSAPLRQLSDDEFQRLVDLTSSARVRFGTPPSITGDSVADARLRAIAEARGYRQRSDVGSTGLVWLEGRQLTSDAASAYRSLIADGRSAGYSIALGSAYRPISRQRQLFVGKLRASGISNAEIRSGGSDAQIDSILRFSSIPGYSRHHTGTVVDLTSGGGGINAFGGTAAFRWMAADNFAEAKRHGFVPSYPATAGRQGPDPEPWEFVFVGRDALTESDAFGRIDDMTLVDSLLTVTGSFADLTQSYAIHVDDQEAVVATANCLDAGPAGNFTLEVTLDPEPAPTTDLCVVAELGVDRRLLRCLS